MCFSNKVKAVLWVCYVRWTYFLIMLMKTFANW